MNIETENNPIYIIRISHAEAIQAAKDPSELQALLYSTLGYNQQRRKASAEKPAGKRGHYKKRVAKEQKPNWASDGNAGHQPRKAAVKNGTVKCEGCGKKMKVQGIGPHHRHCPQYQLKQAGNKAKQQVLSGVE